MNETPTIKRHTKTSPSQVLRDTVNITLIGILSSCSMHKPVSTEGLTKYPSASEVIEKPFAPESTDDIKNLSNFFLQESQLQYVDDNGTVINPSLESSNQ